MARKTFSFNWRASSAHIWFLTTFLKPRAPDDFFNDVDWRRALGGSPARVIEIFQVQGVLARAPLPVLLDVHCTRDELRELCRERDLPVSGTKDVLIQRLVAAGRSGLPAAVSGDVYQCTDYGRSLAEQYVNDPESVLHQAEEEYAETPQEEKLTPREVKKIARWLILEGIVLGVAGNAVYDLLKGLAARAGERLSDWAPQIASSSVLAITPGLRLELCPVPAGYFLMGSSDRDPEAYDNEKPQHRVYVPAFSVAKYPVTNGQYRAFVQATGHRQPDHWQDGFPREKENHPVVYVSWSDAVAFCDWAARLSRRPVRLLTEAEWEKAARGTDGRLYPWGNLWRPDLCNTSEAGNGDTTLVDRYPRGRSPYGVVDMIGNVWEWTSTIYKSYPYQANDGREIKDESASHVFRGGSWYLDKRAARAACRYHFHGVYWNYDGFRVGVAAPFS